MVGEQGTDGAVQGGALQQPSLRPLANRGRQEQQASSEDTEDPGHPFHPPQSPGNDTCAAPMCRHRAGGHGPGPALKRRALRW